VAEGAEPVYRTAEALELWRACVPISADAEVWRFVREERAIGNAVRLADLDVCRALPLDVRPSWTTHRPDPDAPWATWAETGHRLVVPLVDARGAVRSVLARAVRPSPRKSTAKGERAGLIMAEGLARQVLERGALPEWWGEGGEPLRVVVAEGEVDFLAWTAEHKGERAPAVLGMFSGSWSAELAARLPDGCVVVIATDADAEGEKYARKIVDSFAPRLARGAVRLERWKPTT